MGNSILRMCIMKKSYKINLKNNSVAIYSPSNFNIKEGTNFLQEKLYEIRDVEEVINNSKMIVLMLDEACECNFHFCDEEVCDDVLNNYYSYFKRGIEVKNNTLLITDTKKLESFSSLDMNNTFELENGYYNVHFFSRYDKTSFPSLSFVLISTIFFAMILSTNSICSSLIRSNISNGSSSHASIARFSS